MATFGRNTPFQTVLFARKRCCAPLYWVFCIRDLSEQMNIRMHTHTHARLVSSFSFVCSIIYLSMDSCIFIYTVNYSLILHYLFSYLNYFGFSYWEFTQLSPLSLRGTLFYIWSRPYFVALEDAASLVFCLLQS